MSRPKFEKRQYKAIAEVIRKLHPGIRTSQQWTGVKTMFGDMLAEDNPKFDRGKFEEACEP